MKIVNLRKKIGATLLAAGMITPGAAYAAGVNINLLVDPSFEDVDPSQTGSFDTAVLLSWSDGNQVGSTYRYDQDYDKPQDGDGACGFNDPACNPPSPGLRYFTANFPNSDTNSIINTNEPGEVMQIVDVSTGASASAIAAGQAEFWISGWFGAYTASATITSVLWLDFKDGEGGSLGTTSVTGNIGTWNFNSATGSIPVGTATVEASVFIAGFPNDTWPDDVVDGSYIDLAEFTIHAIPEPSSVLLVGLGILGAGAFSRKRKA